MITMIIGVLLAALFDFILFKMNLVNFWWGMAGACAILALLAIVRASLDGRHVFAFRLRYLLWGVFSALLLYFIFWTASLLMTGYSPALKGQIVSLYSLKQQLAEWKIAALLFFVIAPGEEIFWRGMVQRLAETNFGAISGWIIAAILYGAVHLWSGNLLLSAAAVVAGLYWGYLYRRFGTLWPGIVSHAIWSLLIFILYPI